MVEGHGMQRHGMQRNAVECSGTEQCSAMQCNAVDCTAVQCPAPQCNKCTFRPTSYGDGNASSSGHRHLFLQRLVVDEGSSHKEDDTFPDLHTDIQSTWTEYRHPLTSNLCTAVLVELAPSQEAVAVVLEDANSTVLLTKLVTVCYSARGWGRRHRRQFPISQHPLPPHHQAIA